jgi:hypothetical protein
MKKLFVLIAVLVLMFLIVFGIITCMSFRKEEKPVQAQHREYVAPELDVSLSTRFFSPDGDGVDDQLFITVNCRDESPIAEWKLAIMEPEQPNQIFFEQSGKGNPPGQIVWDGRSSKRALVQSATDYPFTLTVKNVHGLSSTRQGLIRVDVLVMREGNQLRMQVSSIVFGSNTGGFAGLSEETLARNDYTLKRIAQILNKFNDYTVTVEGHANYTATTEAGKRREQERELRPLSAQRARFVADYLVKLGVDRSRLTAVGIGGDRPIVKFEDRDNWWKNRRVEFILVK